MNTDAEDEMAMLTSDYGSQWDLVKLFALAACIALVITFLATVAWL